MASMVIMMVTVLMTTMMASRNPTVKICLCSGASQKSTGLQHACDASTTEHDKSDNCNA